MTDNPLETPGPGRLGAKVARMMLAAVAVVAFAAVAGLVFWFSEQQARKIQVGIPDFSSQEFKLTDQSGASRSASDFAGEPVALFFGYTYCPDVCPMTLTLLANALDEVGYLSLFDTEVIGLTGSSEALVKVQRDFGAYASRVERDDGVVLWDHTATVYLYDADGRFIGTIVFNEPLDFVTEKLVRLFAAG